MVGVHREMQRDTLDDDGSQLVLGGNDLFKPSFEEW